MSLGELALHIAGSPRFTMGSAIEDAIEALDESPSVEPASTLELLAVHDDDVMKAKEALAKLGDSGLQKSWRMVSKAGDTLFEWPKATLVRSYAFKHVYHHRGQLSVYLRLLDVPAPSIYGPSADESLR
jgi:uncharacterized damage-inducible protein DinB